MRHVWPLWLAAGCTTAAPTMDGTDGVFDPLPDDTATATATGGGMSVACTETDNPLRYTCDVHVDSPQAVQVTWARVDGLSVARASTSDAAQSDHTLDVMFLAPDQAYTIDASTVDLSDSSTARTEITTGSVPSQLTSYLLVSGASTAGLMGTEAPCAQAAVAVIYDTATGDLVWYQNLDPAGSLGMLDMVRFTPNREVLGETNGHVVKVDLMGNDLVRFPVSYPGCCSLNHDIFEWSELGLYVSQYQASGGGLTVDNVVVLDASGVEQHRWEPAEYLTIPPTAQGDYLHTNSEWVDAEGNLYVSWYSRSALAKISGSPDGPAWAEPAWIMTGDGQPGDLGNDITVDWSAVGGPDQFVRQHNFSVRRDGRLMVLDSVGGRALIFSVDEKTMTATVDAAFPTWEARCGPQGTAMETATGNPVVACQSAWVREYDLASENVLWEAQIQCPNGGGGGWSSGSAVRWYPLDFWE